MEKTILKLIGNLTTLLDCPNYFVERLSDYEPLASETIAFLDSELPKLLQYCKDNELTPELSELKSLLCRVINKYGFTQELTATRHYTINVFPDTLREIEECGTPKLEHDFADSCKPWLYWLTRYYPDEETERTKVEPRETPNNFDRNMPSELDTEQARKYFARAVEAGLMSEQYKWLASQVLLACFCREMSIKLGLGKGVNSDNTKRLSWKPFEVLFGIERGKLRSSLNDFKKTEQEPIGIEIVTSIFLD